MKYLATLLDKLSRFLSRKSVQFFSDLKTSYKIEGRKFQAPVMENNFSNISKLVRKFSELKNRSEGMVAIDVGANVGLYSSALLLAGFDHVHSFEPMLTYNIYFSKI